MSSWVYIWLAVIVFSVLIELATTELVSIWFVAGGVVALVLAACGLIWYIHLPVFIAISLIFLICFRKIAMKSLQKKDTKTNAEAVIGKEFTLLTSVTANTPGTIKVNGVIWNVVTKNDMEEVKKGVLVKVKEIKGNKYIVEVVK